MHTSKDLEPLEVESIILVLRTTEKCMKRLSEHPTEMEISGREAYAVF